MKNKLIVLPVVVAFIVFLELIVFAIPAWQGLHYDFSNDPGQYDTYINATESFDSYYGCGDDPTIAFVDRKVSCESSNATLSVTLYGRKKAIFSFLPPSEHSAGTININHINVMTNTWYGWTYHSNTIKCTPQETMYSFYGVEDYIEPSLRFHYEIANTNNYPIHTTYGNWKVICSYDGNISWTD